MKQEDRRRSVCFVLGVLLMVSSFALHFLLRDSVSEIAARTSARIAQRSEIAAANLREILNGEQDRVLEKSVEIFKRRGTGYYFFRNDTLLAWNNAQIPFNGSLAKMQAPEGFVRLNSGYFYYLLEHHDRNAALALIPIKPAFELRNRFLPDGFANWLEIPSGLDFSEDDHGDAQVVVKDRFLFSLKGTEDYYISGTASDSSFFLFLAGLIAIFTGVLLYLRIASPPAILIVLSAGLLLRFLMLVFQWPSFFYEGVLYDVRIFGNARSFLNGYLGDMLINSICLLFLCSVPDFLRPELRQKRIIFLSVFSLLLAFTIVQINAAMMSLVTNSTLNFNLLDFVNVSGPAFAGLVCLSLFSLAVFQLLRLLVLSLPKHHKKAMLYYSICIAAVCFLVYFLQPQKNETAIVWVLPVAITIYLVFRNSGSGLLPALALHLLFMSVFSSLILNKHMQINQEQDLAVLSHKLGERQDVVLENEFAKIPQRLTADKRLQNLIEILPATEQAIRDFLREKYFGSYFMRYNVGFSLFDAKCLPLLKTSDPLLLSEGYFTDQIRYRSDTVAESGLFFVREHLKNSRYIGKMTLGDKRLYIMMEPRQFEELGSFPDLLLDASQQRPQKLMNFSYAVYRSGQNTSSFGSLNYPPFLPDSATLSNTEPEFAHRFFRPDPFTTIVISNPWPDLRQFFTYNSYILLLYGIVTYFAFIFYTGVFKRAFIRSSLTRRIQTVIIVLLLLAMSAVGLVSARLVRDQYADENRNQLREKTEIIYTDLTGFYKPSELFDPSNREAVNSRLNEYARLFNTDVSLFDHRGMLYATSQPRLYELGLSAGLTHPMALRVLSNNRASSVAISEKAGQLTYLSLYTAVHDRAAGRPSGYINLPYFARQDQLLAELSGIISGLVNVYVILFLLSLGAGLVLAGYITRPLRLIQQQIARISLGKANEKIAWQGNDELGRLISEYNQMLVKLEESALLLARSERESAWREMAKQVAHEIKNPLTPMKLNLQYLQHLMKSDPADFRHKFEKTSAGIIEQIDALANIATEFSNFAKLPVTQVKSINIVEAINASFLLFENRGRIRIRNLIPEEQIMVKGDRDQCLRVFNNLFTNAVQALQNTEDPWIEIDRQASQGKVVICVRDNGSGIDEALRNRIFTPNFTTKSTGSGLGLAMVKNIMEGFGGSIWFSSEKGVGTMFYLEFESA